MAFEVPKKTTFKEKLTKRQLKSKLINQKTLTSIGNDSAY